MTKEFPDQKKMKKTSIESLSVKVAHTQLVPSNALHCRKRSVTVLCRYTCPFYHALWRHRQMTYSRRFCKLSVEYLFLFPLVQKV